MDTPKVPVLERLKQSLVLHVKEHTLVFMFFILTTCFLLYQHYMILAWDFSAYVLNARYYFFNGTYFELYRAPLVSLLLGFFLLFGKTGEYIFILFVTTLFYYALLRIHSVLRSAFLQSPKKMHVSFFLFYVFICGFFLLQYGTLVGTELLALAFFMLFLANYFEERLAGHYLALAFLTRYNFLFFVPLLFLRKDIKVIVKDVVLFLVVSMPWFIWNYIHYENFLASVIDSYSLNVLSRQHLIEPFNIWSLVSVIDWKIPFFIGGIILSLHVLFKSKIKQRKHIILIFCLVFLIIFYDVISTPFKVERYLFNFILPITFFSWLGALFLIKHYALSRKTVLIVFGIIFLTTLLMQSIVTFHTHDERTIYKRTAEVIIDENITHCKIRSAVWVPVAYYTENVYFLNSNITDALQHNDIILIFKDIATYDDNFTHDELHNYTPFFENEDIYLIGNKEACNLKYETFNYPHSNDFCKTFAAKFGSHETAITLCNVVLNFSH